MAVHGMKVTDPLTLPRDQRRGVPHTLCILLYHTDHTLCNPALPAPAHTPGTVRKRDEELQKNSLEAQHPHDSNFCSQQLTALSMRHSRSFHMEISRPTEGFTNKVAKISKHFSTLSFSHELSGNIYGTIPSYLWNKAIFIYRRHRGGEKEPKKLSNWKDCSINGTMKNNKKARSWCLPGI